MYAIRLVRWNEEPELVELPTPTPGPGEVLLRVEAAGLCHSDLHMMEWPEGSVPFTLPFTLGHETAGTVAALGPGAAGVREGDRVAVYSRWGCQTCRPCLEGVENGCVRSIDIAAGFGGGVGRDGGLAEYMIVPSARYLVPIDGLDPAWAAPLTDAALTPYHAIRRCSDQLRPGATALVIGVGGLGHMAIQLLRALTSVRIVAVDVRSAALDLARAAGADLTLAAVDLTPDALRNELGGPGVDVVLDCVASDSTLALAAGSVAVGASLCYIGRGGGSLSVAPGRLPFECSVLLPSWGTLPELVEVVALARAGAIDTEIERFGLDQAIEAYRRLDQGLVRGRAVVTPPGRGHFPT
jgi:propanol-preferring alcohol dehydrogenase